MVEDTVRHRLKRYISYKGLSQAGFASSIERSINYVNAIKESIPPDVIHRIVILYPDLDITWLMTGEGEMLNKVKLEDDVKHIHEPAMGYGVGDSVTMSREVFNVVVDLSQSVKIQEQTIKSQQDLIAKLNGYLIEGNKKSTAEGA